MNPSDDTGSIELQLVVDAFKNPAAAGCLPPECFNKDRFRRIWECLPDLPEGEDRDQALVVSLKTHDMCDEDATALVNEISAAQGAGTQWIAHAVEVLADYKQREGAKLGKILAEAATNGKEAEAAEALKRLNELDALIVGRGGLDMVCPREIMEHKAAKQGRIEATVPAGSYVLGGKETG